MRMITKIQRLTGISLLILFGACTKQAEPAKVSFSVPMLNAKIVSQSVTAMSTEDTGWGLPTPTATSSLDCFAVFVGGGADPDMNRMSCETNAGTKIPFGYFAGLVARNQQATVTIPSGNGRTFTLVGFDLADGATCEQLPELTQTKYSAPIVIGRTVADIAPGDNAIKIDAAISATTLASCNFQSASGPSSGFYLGSGLDGDLNVSSNVDLSTTMNQDATRYLTTTARIQNRTATANAGEYVVDLQGSPNATNFGVGDEVMIYVAAEGTPGDCGTLFPGFKLDARVTQAANYISGYSTLGVKIPDSRFATVSNANLAAAGVSGTNFCRVVATRVPHLRNVTLTGSGLLAVPGFGPLNAGPNQGGVLAMRVLGNMLVQGSNFIDASGKGFQQLGASSGRGESVGGASASTAIALANGGGGADSTYSAGGGGHGGSGLPGLSSIFVANVASAGGVVGDQYGCGPTSLDPLMRCLFGKVFFGGAGGHAQTGTGLFGHGGGIIQIFANNVVVASGATLAIKTNGVNGDALNAGGAGGSLLLRALNLKVDGTLYLKARGGDGGDATTNRYGAGGGGRIHIDVLNDCQNASAANVDVNGGVAGPGNGTPRPGLAGTFFKTGAAATRATCLLP